ncbi:hypothetical protein D3C71_798540 [compost metagenome]|jgi:hypothetical protein
MDVGSRSQFNRKQRSASFIFALQTDHLHNKRPGNERAISGQAGLAPAGAAT